MHLYPHTLTFTTVLWINCPSVLYFGTGSPSLLPIQTFAFVVIHFFSYLIMVFFFFWNIHYSMCACWNLSYLYPLPHPTSSFVHHLIYLFSTIPKPLTRYTYIFLHFLFSFIQIIFLSQKSTKALMMIKKIPFNLLRPTIHFHFTYARHISSIWCRWLHPPSETPFSLVFSFWPHCLFFLVSYPRL